jgi:hypothetical protein
MKDPEASRRLLFHLKPRRSVLFLLLIFGLTSPSGSTPDARAQAAPGEGASGSSAALPQATVVSQKAVATPKAVIYVYRKRKYEAHGVTPALYVNQRFAGLVRDESSIRLEVDSGKVLLAVTSITKPTVEGEVGLAQLGQFYPPKLRWPSCYGRPNKIKCYWDNSAPAPQETVLGCSNMDWRAAHRGQVEDITACHSELMAASGALLNWMYPGNKGGQLLLGLMLPTAMGAGSLGDAIAGPRGDQSAWLQLCGGGPFPPPSPEASKRISEHIKAGDYSDPWTQCMNQLAAADHVLELRPPIELDAHPGETYFFEWSYSTSGGKFVQVDQATATQEIAKLR